MHWEPQRWWRRSSHPELGHAMFSPAAEGAMLEGSFLLSIPCRILGPTSSTLWQLRLAFSLLSSSLEPRKRCWGGAWLLLFVITG